MVSRKVYISPLDLKPTVWGVQEYYLHFPIVRNPPPFLCKEVTVLLR